MRLVKNLKNIFNPLPNNSKYTSPNIQNDLIKAASNLALKQITI